MRRRVFQRGFWGGLALGALLAVLPIGAQSASALDFFGPTCQGAGSYSAICGSNGQDAITGTNGVILRAANLIALITGVAAVIMIIIGGFMLVTAAGDASRVSTARKTIIYAIVGLFVAALSRAIVIFVVTKVG